MEWSDVEGIDQEAIDKLAECGVSHPAALAGVEDEADLARRAGLDVNRTLQICAAARSIVESLFVANGVTGPEDLAHADSAALAAATGLPETQIAFFVGQARRATGIEDPAPTTGGAPEEPAETTREEPPAPASSDTADASDAPDAVLLDESSDLARVRLAGAVKRDIRILTAREDEDAQDALAEADGDAVVLQERATVAPVRLDGQLLPPLPIYRLRNAASEGAEEERVRVGRIKEEPIEQPTSGGLLKRFRRGRS